MNLKEKNNQKRFFRILNLAGKKKCRTFAKAK